MLDQNTDRMWYVIGAIVIGAAIIAMGLNIFDESFDSVDGMFTTISDVAGDYVFNIDGGVYSESELEDLISEGYIPIETLDDLLLVSDQLDGKYIQVSNINMSDIDDHTPIGGVGEPFTGSFDGGGFIISNLTIKDGGRYRGLFGQASNAILKNINIVNANVDGGFRTGGLVGHTLNTKVYNSTSSGIIYGDHDVGGLVGCNDGFESLVFNSSSSAKVVGKSEDNAGGLVGWTGRGGVIEKSYATGDVLGHLEVGGLVGDIGVNGKIIDTYATGNVSSDVVDFESIGRLGGLVGNIQTNGVIERSYASNRVDGVASVGSLVGRAGGGCRVVDSYYNSDLSVRNDSGLGVGLSSDDMMNHSSFNGWDFEYIWMMGSNGYPTLR